MNKNITYLLLPIVIFTTACNNDEEEKDLVNTINKNGSIETSVSVNHIDSLHDVLITKHIIWANGAEAKNIVTNDTIPALGNTNTEAENEEGDKKNVTIKKAYEIFITVK